MKNIMLIIFNLVIMTVIYVSPIQADDDSGEEVASASGNGDNTDEDSGVDNQSKWIHSGEYPSQ